MEHLVLVASYSLLAAGPILFLVLWFVEAPYGKFASTSSGTSGRDFRSQLLKHLQDEAGCACMRKYLSAIYAEENLDFYRDVEKLHEAEDGEVAKIASDIFDRYLANSAETPINVSAIQRRVPCALASKQEWRKDIYDEIQKAVVTLMLNNAWTSYIESKLYKDYVKSTTKIPTLDARWGWVLMECPCFFSALLCFFFLGDYAHITNPYCLTVFGLYIAHYFNRSFIYPLSLTGPHNSLPLYIASLGFINNLASGFIQGTYLGTLSPLHDNSELTSVHFLVGISLFVSGWAINNQSDNILKNLRKPGETGYKIPYGGAFNCVTAANYFGELLEWLGYAIAQWGLPGFVLFFFTFCNLAPRARKYHLWYLKNFDDYPQDRKILIPFVW